MQYRRFGRTELQMPVFSCGGMRYQHKWQDIPLAEIPAKNQANLEATIRRAVELGINHIETARGYGSSERQLGLVLPSFPRDEIVVQTKIQPTADPADFIKHFHESLDRLQLDHVDLLGIHGVNNHRELWYTVRKNGCLAAARELQRQGKTRHVGFSTHGPPEVVLDAIQSEDNGGFDYINLHWYYIYQQNWPAIEQATQRDMGVFIISPTEKGGMLHRPPKKMVELCRPLHPLVFNCLFCLSHPQIHTLSIGASKPAEFDLQLTTLELLDRADELLPPIDQSLRAAMVEAVGHEVADQPVDGLSHWEEIPGLTNIATVLWLRNLALGWDLVEYAKMRYNLLGNGGTWFQGLHARYAEDFDIATSVAKSPIAAQIPGWLAEAQELLYSAPKKRVSQE